MVGWGHKYVHPLYEIVWELLGKWHNVRNWRQEMQVPEHFEALCSAVLDRKMVSN